MRSTIVAALAAVAAAAPAPRQAGPTDAQILNYALTLEHLEDKFYRDGLANFTSEDFRKAGASKNFYNNLKEISSDEQTHVSFLTTALQGAGAPAVAECTYNFGVTDAAGFLALANILEGVGVSAYLGAAAFISTPAYLTAAGSILTVEARHSAYLRTQQTPGQSPFPSPFDIPLDFDEVYSLASQFIVSCPDSNPALPVKAFPALSVVSPMGSVCPGTKLTLKSASDVEAKAAYFITSMGPLSAPLEGSGTDYYVTVPQGVPSGQDYLVLTKDDNMPTDNNIVAGPAIVMVKDNAAGESGGHWNGWGDKPKYGHGGDKGGKNGWSYGSNGWSGKGY